MRERIRRILEILAVMTGISGITLSNLRDSYSIAFYSTLALLIFVSIIAFLSWGQNNIFKSKPEIDQIWKRLLLGASRSIRVFAGDVSWIERDEDILKQRTKDGIITSVLCRRPHNKKTIDNILALLETGSDVRYYDPDRTPVARGLLIDSEEHNRSTALTIRKFAKPSISLSQHITQRPSAQRGSGVSGDISIYQHEAVRHLQPKDSQQIQMLSDLFNIVWNEAISGVVLKEVNIGEKTAAQFLQVVPHYNQLTPDQIRLEVVDIQSLWSACTYVKDYKFGKMRSILEAYDNQQIQAFAPCLCISHWRKSILMPPILEEHGGKYVIIDGMHRLFYRMAFMQMPDALCTVISINTGLPSSPVPFENIQIWPRKLPRKQVFRDFKPELFRNIDLLDNALKDNYGKIQAI